MTFGYAVWNFGCQGGNGTGFAPSTLVVPCKKVKGEGKGHPRTGHEDPEREETIALLFLQPRL